MWWGSLLRLWHQLARVTRTPGWWDPGSILGLALVHVLATGLPQTSSLLGYAMSSGLSGGGEAHTVRGPPRLPCSFLRICTLVGS